MSWIFKRDKNWDKLKKMLEPRYAKQIVKKHIRQATRLNGKIYEKQIRDTIKDGNYVKNAPLTEAIKKDNKPLIGVEAGATLFKSITSKLVPSGSGFGDAIFIGILRSNSGYNIAKTVHFGATIKVTDKMRGLFLMLSAASKGKISRNQLSKSGQDLFDHMQRGWKPLRKDTNVIIIPPREFITQAFDDPKPRKLAKQNWQQALKNAFAEIRASR